MKKLLLTSVTIIITSVVFLFNATAAPDQPSTQSSPPSHEIWDKLLKKHVTSAGKVDYQGFMKDSTELNKYLAMLSSNSPNNKNWRRDIKKAYWINAYNAFTVQLIIRNYPVESIKDLTPGGVTIPKLNSPWTIKFFKIDGEEYNLDRIEHKILRKQFADPRIHFAINCAAKSCPKLRNEAYTADKLHEQLEDQATYFINNQNKNMIAEDKADISQIFTWFKGDFTREGSLIDYLNRYSKVQIKPDAEITYNEYDWYLNE